MTEFMQKFDKNKDGRIEMSEVEEHITYITVTLLLTSLYISSTLRDRNYPIILSEKRKL